jgi:hypothetical protein
VLVAACAASQPTPQEAPRGEDKAITAAQCAARHGTVVGDIGDGAIHRPDYVCASGKAPIAEIEPPEDGPRPIEGSVCCPL